MRGAGDQESSARYNWKVATDANTERPIWQSALRTLLAQTISLALVVASLIALPISLFLSYCGITGGLSDTSVWENRLVGLCFLAIAVGIVLMDGVWLCYLRSKSRNR